MTTTHQPKPLPTQEITTRTHTADILANARRDTDRYGLDKVFICDVDSHHAELNSWKDIISYVEDPVLRDIAQQMMIHRPQAGQLALSNYKAGLALQDAGARIPHQSGLAESVPDTGDARDVELVCRAMDAMSIDIQVVFPQPMLEIGLHPEKGIAVQLMKAYNRWFVENVLPKDPRIKTMLGLPFEDPQASLETIREFGDHPDVLGFLVTSQRHAGVHRNEYMPLYAELEERGLPIGFHAGPTWEDSMTSTMNRFLSVHAMSFVTCNMTHLTNWIVNGIPERFPRLKTIWIESGLAWLPFMMQRLDHEYLMRQSEAPLLRRLPSDYMRQMYYTSQPIEITDMALLESTFNAMNAKDTLLYSSDWPHWDFDVPGRIMGIPFLDEQAKLNILGGNARKVFNL
ncbi:amidohydrolase family protein [Streptomyces sp. S465]|uniref:amidohydrolase family protein n=1 Tax=Streptomyces sp. S465 TaxID=2979468 RepID=UPI0022A82851|nr:amidohydrolase family protein [Streptomyces sp. S465]WAP53821.1 amidohydrolase family protein [Streptomyces sp. S465]